MSVFDDTIMSVPLEFPGGERFRLPFPTGPGKPRIIIVAGELMYCPCCEPKTKEGLRYCREAYFTDADTAEHLRGRTSAIAQFFPDGAIQRSTVVKTGYNLEQAARASMSDPYYINLQCLDGRHYVTGAINLHPIELAHALADEVIIPSFYPVVDVLGQSSWGTFFRFDIRAREVHVNQQPATHWIDFSDFSLVCGRFNFDPRMAPNKDCLQNFGAVLTGRKTAGVCPVHIEMGVPKDLCEFREKIQQQWSYGYERTREAFRQPFGSREHLRIRTECELLKARLKSTPSASFRAR